MDPEIQFDEHQRPVPVDFIYPKPPTSESWWRKRSLFFNLSELWNG
jgi:hypothetical protein